MLFYYLKWLYFTVQYYYSDIYWLIFCTYYKLNENTFNFNSIIVWLLYSIIILTIAWINK